MLVSDSGHKCICRFVSGLIPEQVVWDQVFPVQQTRVLGASMNSVLAVTLNQRLNSTDVAGGLLF